MKHKNIVACIIAILCMVLIMFCVLLVTPVEAAYGITTARQDELHAEADILRAVGYADNGDVIQAVKAAWAQEQEDLNIIAKVIANEAPGVPGEQWCPVWHQATVGQIVVNRTRLDGFPDTVRGVVSQRLPSGYYAYNPSYCYGFDGIDQHYYDLARMILDSEAAELYGIPEDVIFHDNAAHGPIWKTSYVGTGWYRSTTYFCR